MVDRIDIKDADELHKILNGRMITTDFIKVHSSYNRNTFEPMVLFTDPNDQLNYRLSFPVAQSYKQKYG